MSTESGAVTGRIKPAELRAMDRQTFVAAFGEIFEHSPWVAEETWRAGPFDDAGRLQEAMVAAVRRFPPLPQWIQAPYVMLDYHRVFPDRFGEH